MAVPAGRLVLLAFGAFFGHVVYPVTVQVLARRPSAAPPVPSGPLREGRFVSAVVPAYRERTTIGGLVTLLLHHPESPVAEVVVVADDDADTAEVARSAGAVVVDGPGRGGKAGAVNRGVARAQHDVVLLMDANVDLDVQAVRRLVAHVDSGRLDLAGGVRTEQGHAGESMYWAFENATKAAEHRLGGSLALVGELLCLRRDLFRPIPAWVRVDDVFLAVDFATRRKRVSVDTTCVTVEASASPRDQLERRFRVMEALLELLVRRPAPFLTPSRQLLMLHAHRTWRSTGGPVCQAALVIACVRAAPRSPLALGWTALNLFAAADYLACGLRDVQPGGRLRPLLSQALGMPPVVLVGACLRLRRRLLSGGSDGTWTRVER